jgi:hypothetical protein
MGDSPMKTKCMLLIASVVIVAFGGLARAEYTKAVQQACKDDYKKYCNEYGIDTSALRLCMDKAGYNLSNGCVNALIAAGEVSREEVERRRKAGH